ncbi:hypothetical protein B0H16DRAFT_1448502 [Mycena metata]|uniref:Uncharacterized protein n=1 Tax=Mycena metata TaxID=1033252 RepID=A0AAD7NWN8_9AGAR|nr:hypothetical protein B0H16DRAFT_1448502 [Mycena metata]
MLSRLILVCFSLSSALSPLTTHIRTTPNGYGSSVHARISTILTSYEDTQQHHPPRIEARKSGCYRDWHPRGRRGTQWNDGGCRNGLGTLLHMHTLQTMKANKDDLSTLDRKLRNLITNIKTFGAGGDMEKRLTKLSSDLEAIAGDCKSLADKGQSTLFFRSKDYKQNIGDIKNLITSHLHNFT